MDGIVFNVWVFSIRSTSMSCKPADGRRTKDVLERSLVKGGETKEHTIIKCVKIDYIVN